MTDSPNAAWGHGVATLDEGGTVLDVWFPAPALGEQDGSSIPDELAALAGPDVVRRVTREARTVAITDLQTPPASTEDAWLRLHLLSHRLVAPHGHEPRGHLRPAHQRGLDRCRTVRGRGLRADARPAQASRPHVSVLGVDKFPRMIDYVVPTGVRIADADRVRLGAHLASGTTVMHEGFVNFNAGTLGSSMVEGRISAGVVVGDGSDIGGGASIMGTLSGGGKQVISVGQRCLIGANAGIGISLGDDCVVEAGCYVTAGTKVAVSRHGQQAQGDQGRRAVRHQQHPVPPQLHDRRHAGGPVEGRGHRAQRRRCMRTEGVAVHLASALRLGGCRLRSAGPGSDRPDPEAVLRDRGRGQRRAPTRTG